MKILLVANTDWYLYRFRLGLAHFLTQQGHIVTLVSPPGNYAEAIQAQGVRWLAWTVGRQTANPFTELRSFLQLARIFRREQPDLIHLHTIKPVLYGSLAAGLLGRSAVVRSVTGLGYVFLGSDWRASVLRGVVTSAYRLLTLNPHGATIFENEHDRDFFIRQGLVRPTQSIVINGVGVDTDTYHPLPEPDGPLTVVLAARMLWDKGVGEFVEAARLLKDKLPARFVLVGDSDPGNPSSIPQDTLRAWVEEGIVEWWGWQNDMRAVFSAAHVVVLPSYGEGLPTVLIEAAACARPLVATAVPGCRDVVQNGRNGWLVPPKDAPALAAAIARLLQEPAARAEMGRASRRLAEEQFSARVVNASTYALYQRVLSGAKVE